MSLEVDKYYKKPLRDSTSIVLDKRRFKGQLSIQELTFNQIIEALKKIGIEEGTDLARELMKLKYIYQLNKILLCLVYNYFKKKEFDLEKVVENFEEDFQDQLNLISKLNLFKKLEEKNLEYEFRQDFISYLFLINDFCLIKDYTSSTEESTESIETYEEYSEYEKSIIEEEKEPPLDREDYRM